MGNLRQQALFLFVNTNYDDAALLWAIIRSSVMQKQFHHVASGYTQRGISKEHLQELRFPLPIKDRKTIIGKVKQSLVDADKSRTAELAALKNMTSLVDKALEHNDIP